MSYGLIVKSFDAGGNEIIQIDTTKGLTNYVVVRAGTGSSIAVGTFVGKNRRIFVRPKRDASGNYLPVETFTTGTITNYDLAILAGTHTSSTIKFVTTDEDLYYEDGMSWYSAHSPVQVDYIVMEDVTGVDPVGDYGLQTLSAGGESAFDSRKIKFNNTIQIDSIIPPGALGGAAGTTDVISNDSNKYIEISWSWWDSIGTKAGLQVRGGTKQIRHLDIEDDEYIPGSGDINYPPNFYDNYAAIMIATN